MAWNSGLSQLRDLLAELCPTEKASRQIVTFAGLDDSQIPFDPSASLNWFQILSYADRHDRVGALVEEACKAAPKRCHDLTRAELEYRAQSEGSAAGRGGPGETPSGGEDLLSTLHIDPDDPPYAALRQLLGEAFSAQELLRFCQDRADFRPVTTSFGPGHGLDDLIDQLLEYCRTRLLWDELVAGLIQVRPNQVQRFSGSLGRS